LVKIISPLEKKYEVKKEVKKRRCIEIFERREG